MSDGLKKCGVTELASIIKQDRLCQIIDVREPFEHEASKIAGSKLIPLKDIEKEVISGKHTLNFSKTVYLVCQSGQRATAAWNKLNSLGYKDVVVVEGGMNSWVQAGLPVEKGSRNIWALERQVRFTAGLLVLSGVVLSYLVNRNFIFLSAFVGLGLTLSSITNTCPMASLLGLMPWNKVK